MLAASPLEVGSSMEYPNHVFSDEAIVQHLEGGTVRRILARSDKLMVCELSFPKGAEGAPHTHVHEQATYVISGRFEFVIDGESVIVEKGDTLYFKSGVLHGNKCLEEGVIIDFFTPQREDFLA